MTKEEFVNKYVSEHFPDLHVNLSNLIGSGDVKSLYDTLHAKLISLAGSNVSVDYPLLHQYLIDLIYGLKPLDANGHEYVDMGEAGIWATCNVGASSPEQRGLYFQWGDIQGYTAEQVGNGEGKKIFNSNFSDYKWCDGSNKTLTKYCTNSEYGKDGFTDNLTILELEDDAAHVHMGGDWRMPTTEEFQKLYNLCNSTWVADYNGTGMKGRLFTLKTDSSKQLFFPAAGYCGGGIVNYVGRGGNVWSSSLFPGDPSRGFEFGFNLGQVYPSLSTGRCSGHSVRGFLGVGSGK